VPTFITEKQLHPKLRARINVSYWAVVLLYFLQVVVLAIVLWRCM
jgi:hypothetical protein